MTRATLTPVHVCVACRALPVRPFDPADVDPTQEYRPTRPRPTVSGGPRSRVCRTHERAKLAAQRLTQRTADKATRYGVPRPIQVALWAFQGFSCPCGRKCSKVIPAGVTLDHAHAMPCVGRDHPENRGCLNCVTGFLCQHCNREILGRLEGSLKSRIAVVVALHNLADHINLPPMLRLRAERPDLFEESAA